MTSDFEDLRQITAILEERALARHREVLSEEASLRAEINEIESLRHETLRQDATAHARQMLGADGLWQGWLARRRMALNQDLAMVQVRKYETQSAAQTAFSRKEVTRDLARTAEQERRRAREARDEMRREEDFRLFREGREDE